MSSKLFKDPIRDKRCQWCGLPLETADNRVKYHTVNIHGVHCKDEARKEKTNRRVQNHYKKYPEIQDKKNIEKLGTPDTYDLPPFRLKDAPTETYLGILIAAEAWGHEYKEIHKLRKKICVKPYSKGKQQQKDTLYKGVSPSDYDNFNITFLIENPGPCPVCGEQLQEKDLTRCELICRNPDCQDEDENIFDGGLVLRGTHFGIDYPEDKAEMACTAQDIAEAQLEKQWGRPTEGKDIAWDKFWVGK